MSDGQVSDAIKDAAASDDSTASIGAMQAPKYPPPRPIDPSRKTFLDLPGELRNEIYALLLPVDRSFADDPRRKDGSRACTAFMASCPQVRDEALDIIDGWVNDAGPVVVRLGGCDWVDDLGPVVFSIIEYRNFSRLPFIKHARRVRLLVDPWAHQGELGLVQDSLFSLLRHLQGEHNLQEVEVQIKIYRLDTHDLASTAAYYKLAPMGNDGYLRGEHDLTARLSKEEQDCDRDETKVPKIAAGYFAAFCLDTMRCINGIEAMQQEGRLKIEVLGRVGHDKFRRIYSWTKLPHLQLLGPDDPKHGDYLDFAPYFELVRGLRQHLDAGSLFGYKGGSPLNFEYTRWEVGMERSRVRGDVMAFRQHHQAAMDYLEEHVTAKHCEETSPDYWGFSRGWCEEYRRYLWELTNKLPAQDIKITRFSTDTPESSGARKEGCSERGGYEEAAVPVDGEGADE